MTTGKLRELVEALRFAAKLDSSLLEMNGTAAAILERLADGALADRASSVYEFHDEAVAHGAIAAYRKAVMGEE